MSTLLPAAPPISIGVGFDTSRYGHHVTFLREDLQPACPPCEFAGWTGGLEVLAEEGHVVAVARGVEADADGDGWSSRQERGHGVSLRRSKSAPGDLQQPRESSEQSSTWEILVMNGR